MKASLVAAVVVFNVSFAASAATPDSPYHSARLLAGLGPHFEDSADFSLPLPSPKLWASAGFSSGTLPSPFQALPSEPTAHATTVFGLPQNMGPWDRVLRAGVGAALVAVGSYGLASKNIPNQGSGVMLGVSIVPFITAITGYCPLYQALGVDYSF